jgi:uncharacterized protein YtpQ (UPF0354 family)
VRIPLIVRLATVILLVGFIAVRRGAIHLPGVGATSSPIGTAAWNKEWHRRIQSAHLDAEGFTQLLAEAARAHLKGARVSVPEPLTVTTTLANGMTISTRLDTMWAKAEDSPSERVAGCERFIRTLTTAGDRPQTSSEKIVPLIRDTTFVQLASKKPLKAEPFVTDLWIVYAYDCPDNFQYMFASDPGALPQLRKQAIRYLRRTLPPVERHGNGPVYMITAGGTFEASLLLLDEFWNEQAKAVDGDLVVAAPARDLLMFTGSRSQAGLKFLRRVIRETMERGSCDISKTLLLWHHGHWEEYRYPASSG